MKQKLKKGNESIRILIYAMEIECVPVCAGWHTITRRRYAGNIASANQVENCI